MTIRDQLGTDRQRIITGSRRPSLSSRITMPFCIGAKLKRGWRFEIGPDIWLSDPVKLD